MSVVGVSHSVFILTKDSKMKLEEYQKNFDNAKLSYLEIMKKENDASRFMAWMVENDVNPYSVFHENSGTGGYASLTSTLEGFVGLYHTIHHALYDDGEFTFIKTEFAGPKIVFYCRHEKNFQEIYDKHIQKGCERIQKIVGFCETVDEFIAEYERSEQEHKKVFEDLENKIRSFRKK